MAEKIEKVILLEIFPYRENSNDAIIKVMNNRKIFSLLARGINKAKSKNRANLQLGCLVEIEYFKARMSNRLSKLKRATLLTQLNYKKVELIKFINKIILFLLAFENLNTKFIYREYIRILKSINSLSASQFHFAKTYLVTKLFRPFGIEPNFYSCHVCFKKNNIAYFNFTGGGYECTEHNDNNFISSKLLELIYFSYHSYDNYIKKTDIISDEFIYRNYLIFLDANGILITWDKVSYSSIKKGE
ncbi:DNA repair protein RecO [Mycoplasmopsis meleagridis]|uniref:DNA repair protein RecO n=1 Tax=Mycoplasmopsis meleagridis TaxID=29561 RepID=UPI003A892BC7